MNFGEKFPYALHLPPKVVQADWLGSHLLQKLTARHTPKLIVCHTPQSILTPGMPHSAHAPNTPQAQPTHHTYWASTPHTPNTPNAHPPHLILHTTPPIPLLLRVDSDEMWQKPVGFWLMEVLECSRASTKWTPRAVQTRLERSSKAVCCERGGANEGGWGGFLRILPRLRKNHTNSKKIT